MKEAGSCQLLCTDVNMTEETQAVRWLPAIAFTFVSAYLSECIFIGVYIYHVNGLSFYTAFAKIYRIG